MKNISKILQLKLLYLGLIMFSFLAYKVAFVKSLKQYHLYQLNSTKIEAVNSLNEQNNALKKQMQALDKLIGGDFKIDSFQSYLIGRINELCTKYTTVLKSYKEPDQHQFQSYSVDTYTIEISGSYAHLVQLIHHIEVKEPLGKLISVDFNMKEDKKAKTKSLVASLYLQTTQKNKQNEN
tara:strand:+ start:458 stop:997 length:540 start_codon:yes stop_codon:yes gene_type:complete